jgi:glycerophosphoryl diester phosphodiesterase
MPASPSSEHPYFAVPRPTVLGHRGSAGSAPENTLASFAIALEQGADIVESDVHVTADGVPVLIHDPSVDRTTNGAGLVADLTFEELGELDAGFWFGEHEADAFPERGCGHRVPGLAEAFERFPDARFNLEIKAPGTALAQRVLELLREFERAEHTLLTAGEDSDMASLRTALAGSGVAPAIGASLADILEVVQSALESRPPATDSMAIQIPDSFGGKPLVTEALVRHAHAHGIVVHVWTINEPSEMKRLLDLGVDGLVTDYPGRMAELVRTRG